jgi:hypothetical protein
MNLADQARGVVPRAAEVPALERLALARQRVPEPDDSPVEGQFVVAEKEGEGSG